MKWGSILIRLVNFTLFVLCIVLLFSCGAITCPPPTRNSVPKECEIVREEPWYYYCEEGQYNGRWGCCEYQCHQVKCEGMEGQYNECESGGTVKIDARCDSASGRCVQQTGVSQPTE